MKRGGDQQRIRIQNGVNDSKSHRDTAPGRFGKKRWFRLHWALIPVIFFYLCAFLVFLYAGDRAQIGIPDNLDLFQAQYQMLKNTHSFSSRFASAPFLHGISRDVLPSERSLEAILYQIFPSLAAYLVMYFVKITIGMVSFSLLAGELDRQGFLAGNAVRKQDSAARWNLSLLCGLVYGILNLFPSFGIAFASIPLLVWLVLRLERETEIQRIILWLVLIACYPFLSYFSYFGIFLVGYLLIAFLWKSIVDSVCGKREAAERAGADVFSGKSAGRKGKRERGKRGFHPDLRLLAAVLALSTGYVGFEYRLFRQILLSSEPSIRDTMVQTSLSGREILSWILHVFLNGVDMHCESMQKYIVLPVCLTYFLILNIGYLRCHRAGRVFRDVYNLAVLILVFNSVIYGLYYSEGFRSFVESLVPPLKGFQFNRTAFFNPFLWYGMFFIALYRMFLWIQSEISGQKDRELMMDSAKNAEFVGDRMRGRKGVFRIPEKAVYLPWILTAAAGLVVIFHGNSYNDLLNTAKADVKQLAGRPQSDTLNYGDFYSVSLFDEIKDEIGYAGEWSVAYGFHPAVLEYNGISTLDGYLGFYSQEYKEQFRKVIAPALEENEASREYFDDWGARCYIYSGHNATVVEAVRNYPHPSDTIDIDPDALRELGCTYVFSRIRITNADEKELELLGEYADNKSPYIIYVYTVK